MASKLQDLINRLCPNGVEYRRLGDCVTKITDGMHNLPKEISSNGEFPIISAQNVNNGLIDISTTKFVPRSVFEIENRRTNVSIGDVLLTIVGAVGRVAVVKEDIHVLCQRSLCVIKPVKGIVAPKFLGYVLEGVECQQYMAVNAHGAAQKGLYLDQVSKMLIPVPPLEVQGEIVQILDNFAELTAELTAELEKRKKQYEHYRRELMATREMCFNFSEHCMILRGEYITKKESRPGNVPVILGGQEPAYYIDRANHTGKAIVISRSGASAGFVSYWDEPIFATDGFIIETDSQLEIRYLYHWLKDRQSELNQMKKGGGVPHITGANLASLKPPLPPLAEQRRIVSILDRFDRLCNDLTSGLPAEIAARKKQYAYYRDKLLDFKPAPKGCGAASNRKGAA